MPNDKQTTSESPSCDAACSPSSLCIAIGRSEGDFAAFLQHESLEYTLQHATERIRDLQIELAKAKEEIRVLRMFGNNDCTAMADEYLLENV